MTVLALEIVLDFLGRNSTLDAAIWSAHMVDSNEVYYFHRRSIIFKSLAHKKLASPCDIDIMEWKLPLSKRRSDQGP